MAGVHVEVDFGGEPFVALLAVEAQEGGFGWARIAPMPAPDPAGR